MSAVTKFDEKAVQTGCHSIIKDAEKYALELHLTRTESLFKGYYRGWWRHSSQDPTESVLHLWHTKRKEIASKTD